MFISQLKGEKRDEDQQAELHDSSASPTLCEQEWRIWNFNELEASFSERHNEGIAALGRLTRVFRDTSTRQHLQFKARFLFFIQGYVEACG